LSKDRSSDDLPTQLETLVDPQLSDAARVDADRFENLELDRFTILRKLGEGGMGQVFLARQTRPVERLVALKLIRQRVHSPANLARFEIERQALASMQHPAIAQVYDAGTTPSGYPYFAMEYVDGMPLDRFCQEHRVPLKARLELFVRVCRGIQHAHQKGIIHRDIKPANILVTEIDGVAMPKIIDFGIATATGASESESSSRRDLIGTPQYMSPEQFNLDEQTIDTRSDVYSLGVILYRLLVDGLPIASDLFHTGDSTTLQQVVINRHPVPTPSTRLAADTARARQVAAERGTSARQLLKRLRGDLDAIALKALDADRSRRYSSADELADDVVCALTHRPVKAMPDSPLYRMRRFARRHVVGLGSASAVLLALIGGLTAATLGMIEAQRQQQIAEQRQQDLEQVSRFQQSMLENIDPETMGRILTESMRAQLEAGLESTPDRLGGMSLDQVETFLAMTSPTDLAREMLHQHMLRQAIESVDAEFADQPLLKASLLEAIADVFHAIGLFEPMLELRQHILALYLEHDQAKSQAALQAHREVGSALFLTNRFEEAESLLRELIAKLDLDDRDQAGTLIEANDDLVMTLADMGRMDEAIELAEQNLAKARQTSAANAGTITGVTGTLGYAYARAGQIETALTHFQSALDGARAENPDDLRTISRYMTNVAAALGVLGRFEEALEIDRALIGKLQQTAGRRHANTLRAMGNMANNLRRTGQLDEARRLLEETSELAADTLGPLHPITLRAELNLGSLLGELEAFDQALPRLARVREERTSTLGPEHPQTLMAGEIEAGVLIQAGHIEQGVEKLEALLEIALERFGAEHRVTTNIVINLATGLHASGRTRESRALADEFGVSYPDADEE
jgi:eukaryotic-like serine/threonine-protein kinase